MFRCAKWVLLVACACVPAFAAVIEVDENCSGYIGAQQLPCGLAPDPGPGGLQSVLTYILPFAGFQGDVGLQDGPGGPILDVIRFNGDGTLLFYSDNTDGFEDLADTPAPPGSFYTNLVVIPEVGPEGSNGAMYTPLPGQPGFDPEFNPTFLLQSDGAPEPASFLLFSAGLLAVGVLSARRRARARNQSI